MKLRNLMIACLLIAAIAVNSQENFKYTPEQPKPGEKISVTYTPEGDLKNVAAPIEVIVYELGKKEMRASDLVMTKKGTAYEGVFTTDTANNFVFFSFKAGEKTDHNNEDGYHFSLYSGEKPAEGANYSEAQYYQYYVRLAGGKSNPAKALASLEKELELYPDNRKKNILYYIGLLSADNKEKGQAAAQKEIESVLKAGLNTEEDYQLVEGFYQRLKMPEQSKFFAGLRKQKFPNGKWVFSEKINKFYSESDPAKKKELLSGLAAEIRSNPDLKNYEGFLENAGQMVANSYIAKKDWAGLKSQLAEMGTSNRSGAASIYNNAAWKMQEDSTNLALAEEFAATAVQFSKSELAKPTATKPPSLSDKQWQKSRRSSLGMYEDTYAMVLYRRGQYKKALPYAKDAALVIAEGKNVDENKTYALIAEKALPASKYIPQLEKFVTEGHSGSDVKNILKRAYEKKKGSDKEFDTYYANLQEASRLKMLAELRKSMLDQTAPSFALVNLKGEKVNTAELRGKVLVLDFWATWCGPCKASFPGMQKAVHKYKDDPNVAFLFINSWENAADKEKSAGDFIAKNSYTFNVLMDKDDKVISDFKVEGIPTKFVIDGNGKIRFKSVGFNGSDEKLVDELESMIVLSKQEGKKTF